MKRIARLMLLVAVACIAQACSDEPTTSPLSTGDLEPSLAVEPAVDGFYILPPVGTAQATDDFLGTLSPRVDVCVWDDESDECASGHLASFTTSDGTGDGVIQVSSDEVYEVEWDTGTSDEPIDYETTYQIVVTLGGELLGTADVHFFDTGNAKGSGDEFELRDGRTLPIRFGVTLDALLDLIGLGEDDSGRLADDFVVQTFTTDGGTQTATVPSGDAAFRVDGTDVQVPGDGDEFTLVIAEKELTTDAECEPAYRGPQSGECYLFETIPEGVTFFVDGDPDRPAGLAGVCPDANVTSAYALAKFDDGTTTFPPAAPTDVVSCDQVALDRLPGFLRGLAGLFLPRPLHATDEGETGLVGNFSTLFWATPIRIGQDPDNPEGPFAPEETIALSFRVVSDHDPGVVAPDGTEVTFSASTGALSAATATTSAGTAQVGWTLPASEGTHELTARVPVAPEGDPASEPSVTVAVDVDAAGVVLDGVLSTGEWDDAATIGFTANLPEGGGSPGTIFWQVLEDRFYAAVRFERSALDPQNTAVFEFSEDPFGVRDIFLVNDPSSFEDDVRLDDGTAPRDVDLGGTRDGDGTVANDGTHTIYEMFHPLASGDEFDFTLGSGETIGMQFFLRIIDSDGTLGDTRTPFVQITIP